MQNRHTPLGAADGLDQVIKHMTTALELQLFDGTQEGFWVIDNKVELGRVAPRPGASRRAPAGRRKGTGAAAHR